MSNYDNFFDNLIEAARKSLSEIKRLTYQEKLKMFLDYLDEKYNFYTNSCPLGDLDLKAEDIDICNEEMCCNYGSEKCWLYWLMGGNSDD